MGRARPHLGERGKGMTRALRRDERLAVPVGERATLRAPNKYKRSACLGRRDGVRRVATPKVQRGRLVVDK